MAKKTLKHKQMNSNYLASQYFRFASHFGDEKGLPLALNSNLKKLFILYKLHLITQYLKILNKRYYFIANKLALTVKLIYKCPCI